MPTHAARMLALAMLALLGLGWLWPATAKATDPEQGKIAFGHDGDIWVMNADGSGQTRLTHSQESFGGPAWSPDGQRIAFTSSRLVDGRGPPTMDIWVMNADGSDQTNLSNNPNAPGYQDERPTWSPDGQRIAFSSNRGWTSGTELFNHQLHVMNADGSGVTRLTDGARRTDPAWGPDGRIAFVSEGDVWVMNADGSDQANLTANRESARYVEESPYRPSWSPDAKRIAFADFVLEREPDPAFGDRYGPEVPPTIEYIYAMNADGSGLTPLTSEGEGPDWSPDGRTIAFSRWHDGNSDIWLMNADGTCQENITKDSVWRGWPAWRPLPSAPHRSEPCFTLSVSLSSQATARVIGPGIHCGENGGLCTASFAEGTDLTLKARPGPRASFSGWGGGCAGADRCELTMNGDRQVSATFAARLPNLRVRARPRQRRVGPNKRRVRYAFVVENVGDWPSGRVNLCARGPQRRLRILGNRCVTRQIPAGWQRQRRVRARIKPAARGKVTRIRLIARGPNVQNRRTVARLRVRR